MTSLPICDQVADRLTGCTACAPGVPRQQRLIHKDSYFRLTWRVADVLSVHVISGVHGMSALTADEQHTLGALCK